MAKHCTQCGAAVEENTRFCAKCGTPVVVAGAQADPMVGKVIADRYLLVEKVGQGGSGTIYRGEHTTLRKRVAVKILHTQLSQDEHAIERFRREATTVAEIDNEHILQVIDFGRTEDGRLFFAMEFLEGETLTKALEQGPLSIDRVFDVISQIGEALMEAHGLGYIHRDLRPRNVFLTTKKGRKDFVKLLDFGLAKLILPQQEAKQTALGMTFGDPRYMSPEQARGETVDRRADIYSLGVIAFEMLTGQPPYPGKTFEVLQQHLDAPVPSVRQKRADCPEWLDQVVQKALAKKPEDRFLTVLKMLECLRQRKPPVGADEAEREAHAKLTATAQIKAVGEAFAASGAPPSALATTSPKETQAIGTRAEKTVEKKSENGTTASGSMQIIAPAEPAPVAAANVPSVVVEGSSGEKTVPARPPAMATGGASVSEEMATVPVQKVPPMAMPPKRKDPTGEAKRKDSTGEHKQKDPTGEQWFSESGKFAEVQRAPGGTFDDDEEFAPPKSRSGLIIGGVAGGLTFVGLVVILLLPKPPHKPLHGENGEEQASATPAATPSPSSDKPTVAAAPTTPAPAATAPAPAPTPPAPAPTPPAPAPTVATPTPAPTPSSAPAAALTPSSTIEKPSKPAVVEKPAPAPIAEKVEPAKATAKPEKVAKPEKPQKAEKAPKDGMRLVAAEPSGKKSKSLPEGFKDPFASESKPSASAAQAEFFVKLGRQKLNASDLTAAQANFNKAREYDSKSPDAYAGLGEVAFEQGDYNTAKVNLMQALRLSPNRPRYLVLLGQAYYKLGRAKDAIGEYRKALKIDPNNAEAQHSLEVAERKLAQQGL